ncbi:thialysine N-epsilon-acetyltransferase-like isoform X3 [Caretta caretta]|uniref:thialysine N-epsilon-acetyltransferase-like isoform X3 n=1 Tax=Caretta caretta TaxID=8467 RepID=UPI00209510AD|nr:thialysine N-epsilon-acetyltransferase-like isoform X2 [Caretta caretta]
MNCIIRPCTVKDCKVILQFIKEIAVHYRVPPTEVKVTLEVLREDGFGAQPQYDCYVAELPPRQTNKEGQQIGKRLIEKAAQAAVAKGCGQLRMHIAKTNEMGFLARQGGQDLTAKEGWSLFHFKEDALRRLAARSKF